MKVSDFKTLMKKIDDYITTKKLQASYNNFVNILRQNLQNNQRNQSVEPHMTELFSSLKLFSSIELTIGEKTIFEIMKYDGIIGRAAVERIENVLRDERFDPIGVMDKITKLKTDFDDLVQKSKMFTQYLSPFTTEQDIELKKDEGILKIHFINQANIDNIVDFEKWIDKWYKIIRNFAFVYGKRPEEIRVVFAEKSSPLILELAAACGIINLIGGATLLVLKNIEKYLEIQKKRKEIKKMNYLESQKEILDSLEKESERFKDISAEKITEEILQKIKKTSDKKKDENSLNFAIKGLYDFYDAGGKLETFIGEEIKEKGKEQKLIDEIKEITVKFTEIKKLQIEVENLKLIE